MGELTLYHEAIARIADNPPEYPAGRFHGAGIVTCAGGLSYVTCGWVLVKLLRRLGCRLPVEVWHRGRIEMSERMRAVLETVDGVTCVDASRVPGREGGYRLNGWELKPFAILHSRFERVLFLDCDNVPTRDPSFLLHSPELERHGAIFWPDRWMGEGDTASHRTIRPEAWTACDVPWRDEPEFESGQMVIDKRRCWQALHLAMFLNQHSDFFYEFLLGDKDTFHMAWRRLGQSFAMPAHRPVQDWDDGPVLYQHDFEGRRLFQHRNEDKWDYAGGNLRIPGFQHEEACLEAVDELRRLWDGVVRRYPEDYTGVERAAYREITSSRLFRYDGNGAGLRLVELRPDFRIGIGKDEWETQWEIERDEQGAPRLILCGRGRKMCILSPGSDSSWQGRRLHFDRSTVSLVPVRRLGTEARSAAQQLDRLMAWLPPQDGEESDEIIRTHTFTLHRAGEEPRVLQLRSDHTIAGTSTARERWWYVDRVGDAATLVLCGDGGLASPLVRAADGSWRSQPGDPDEGQIELVPNPEASERPRHIYDTR